MKKQEIKTNEKKIIDKAGKVHIFKMTPRAETPFRIRVIYETGELGPILKVTGKSFDGKSKYNTGKKGIRFYDPETRTGYVKWIADDELLLAVTKETNSIINLTGEMADGKDSNGTPEKYFKIFGSEVTDEYSE